MRIGMATDELLKALSAMLLRGGGRRLGSFAEELLEGNAVAPSSFMSQANTAVADAYRKLSARDKEAA